MTTPLAEILKTQIAATGPITVADYMAACLLHPTHGYYTTCPPFGRDGDFITAPEISQMFGEIVGLALAQAWLDQGAPPDAILAELGPGRGTLMADIRRVFKKVPGGSTLPTHFIEASPALRQAQAEQMPDALWHDDLSSVPDAPILLVANEFLDALPIRQFIRASGGWSERMVGLSEGALSFGLTDALPRQELMHRLDHVRDGDIVETCAPARAIMTDLSTRIAGCGGAALVIDYGGWRGTGDTLQAVQSHQHVPVLAAPGLADLTAHVDFADIAEASVQSGAAVSELTPQGVFLERLGITARAQTLALALSGPALESHVAAHRRLTHPDEMGTLFKVLGVSPQNAPPLAGTRA